MARRKDAVEMIVKNCLICRKELRRHEFKICDDCAVEIGLMAGKKDRKGEKK